MPGRKLPEQSQSDKTRVAQPSLEEEEGRLSMLDITPSEYLKVQGSQKPTPRVGSASAAAAAEMGCRAFNSKGTSSLEEGDKAAVDLEAAVGLQDRIAISTGGILLHAGGSATVSVSEPKQRVERDGKASAIAGDFLPVLSKIAATADCIGIPSKVRLFILTVSPHHCRLHLIFHFPGRYYAPCSICVHTETLHCLMVEFRCAHRLQ